MPRRVINSRDYHVPVDGFSQMVAAPARGTFLFVSGLCALIFQTAWLREFRLIFGASTPASAAVLAIFMGGLGLGNAVLGRRVDRAASPLKLYALFELGISAAAAVELFDHEHAVRGFLEDMLEPPLVAAARIRFGEARAVGRLEAQEEVDRHAEAAGEAAQGEALPSSDLETEAIALAGSAETAAQEYRQLKLGRLRARLAVVHRTPLLPGIAAP